MMGHQVVAGSGRMEHSEAEDLTPHRPRKYSMATQSFSSWSTPGESTSRKRIAVEERQVSTRRVLECRRRPGWRFRRRPRVARGIAPGSRLLAGSRALPSAGPQALFEPSSCRHRATNHVARNALATGGARDVFQVLLHRFLDARSTGSSRNDFAGRSSARCTCPSEAAAKASRSKRANSLLGRLAELFARESLPDHPNGIGGTFATRGGEPSIASVGKRSSRIESICTSLVNAPRSSAELPTIRPALRT